MSENEAKHWGFSVEKYIDSARRFLMYWYPDDQFEDSEAIVKGLVHAYEDSWRVDFAVYSRRLYELKDQSNRLIETFKSFCENEPNHEVIKIALKHYRVISCLQAVYIKETSFSDSIENTSLWWPHITMPDWPNIGAINTLFAFMDYQLTPLVILYTAYGVKDKDSEIHSKLYEIYSETKKFYEKEQTKQIICPKHREHLFGVLEKIHMD